MDGNEDVLRTPHSSSITGASASVSDCLVSYTGHLLVESYPSSEKLSVYSAVPTNRVNFDYKRIFIVTFNHIIVNKLILLCWNTWCQTNGEDLISYIN